jgi:chromodomain-helicase-DNA-binding protein 1
MRPVKKALKQLGNPDPESPQEAHLEHTRRCLLKIGDHINDLLNAMTDLSEMKIWRKLVQRYFTC